MFLRSDCHALMLLLGVIFTLTTVVRADDPPVAGAQLAPQISPIDESSTAFETGVVRSIRVGGVEIDYRVTAGTMPLRSADDTKTIAELFHVAYVVQQDPDAKPRPLTFCFNGGPGSSSVWLHMGMLGPRRVPIPDDASAAAPPYQLEDNPFCLLDQTDLVFIDPISTGYSRVAVGEDKKQFHGFEEDIKSVGQFIHGFVTRHQRWASPIYLVGESYGGVRAAGLSRHLQKRYGMELNGIVLVSSLLNFQTIHFGTGNDLPFATFLPSYTATAWYHKKLDPKLQTSLEQTIRKARRFALGRYSTALMQGDLLLSDRRESIATELSKFTGLPRQFVLDSNLRIPMHRFAKELLRDRAEEVGRLDSRFRALATDRLDDRYAFDPSHAAISGAFTAGVYDYFQRDLGVLREEPYELLTSDVQPWSYKGFENRYVDVGRELRDAMIRNPHLQVFAACGYFDLATPMLGIEYSLAHLGLPEALRKNIRVRAYESGHMVYIHGDSLQRMHRDLIQFYAESGPSTPDVPQGTIENTGDAGQAIQ